MCNTRVYFHHRNSLNKTGLTDTPIPITKAISTQDTFKVAPIQKSTFRTLRSTIVLYWNFYWGSQNEGLILTNTYRKGSLKVFLTHISLPKAPRIMVFTRICWKLQPTAPLSFSHLNILCLHSCSLLQSHSWFFLGVSMLFLVKRYMFISLWTQATWKAVRKTIWRSRQRIL